ncbi:MULTISPECIES: NotI family restriction endonuclease [Hyphomicrobiales]|uniref:NotI family restriction endonuclease n=1 Tax=Hyphomicrobiales TaxID=356 RepID=UPI000FCC4C7B|nr:MULTISPECIES: NotI family restriction endonuclease [Hyphomicrobiales]MCY1741026.1 NotI family restriction endonuclease [Ensifer sp. SL37]RUV67790.1 hypothetical protein EOA78_28925 [Mesorhizobium sp. M5C.F.Cr.IN.023.01.1.1]
MALRITEFFGREPLHPLSTADAAARKCPFVGQNCIKPNHGACSLAQLNGPAVIACPNRLYAENHKILAEIADRIFGFTSVLIRPADVKRMHAAGTLTGQEVAVFGRYWGQELPLQRPKGGDRTGTYYVDWVLARIGTDGKLAEFTAVEVQTIDTTGNYSEQAVAYFAGQPFIDVRGRTPGYSDAGFNWENVNKRILPQLIYKGHVLRREARCTKGLFFVCPIEVLQKVKARLGNAMQNYVIANSTITFRGYQLGATPDAQGIRPLEFIEEFTTAVDEVARALTFPSNLPDMNVYETAINQALSK